MELLRAFACDAVGAFQRDGEDARRITPREAPTADRRAPRDAWG